MGFFYTYYIKQFYFSENLKNLTSKAKILEKVIIDKNLDDIKNTDEIFKQLGRETSTRFTLIDINGNVIGDSHQSSSLMDNHLNRPEIMMALKNDLGTSIRFSSTLQIDMLYLAIPYYHNKNKYIIRTSISILDLQENINKLYFSLIIIGTFVLIVSLILCFYFAQNIGKIFNKIGNHSVKISEGNFNSYLPENNIIELDNLSKSINLMVNGIGSRIKTISRQKNELETILSSMSEAVLALDLNGKILMLNSSGYNLFNLNLDTTIGKSAYKLIRNSNILSFFEEIIEKQDLIEKEIKMTNTDKVLISRGTILLDDLRKPIGAVIVFNDITKIHVLENIRKEFVANVSHELKTPVTAIKGFVETMISSTDNKEQNKFLKIIENHTNRLNDIINDLLFLSRIEGRNERNKSDIEISNILSIIEASNFECQNLIEEKNITLKIECSDKIKMNLNPRLMQVAITNLLTNAIKYSDKNSKISIVVKDQNKNLLISVIDSGIGIEEKHHGRLFERFYRVDSSRNREEGGTGLGLAIVKHIIQMHNGEILIKSEVYRGTTFIINLPNPKNA